MRTRSSLCLLLLVAPLGAAAAQTPVRAPGGTFRGVVQDSSTGQPVAFALVRVLGTDQQVFTAESGRFMLGNLPSGRTRLRVQQIGYSAQTFTLAIDTRPAAGDAGPGFVVSLVRQVTVLPEISVEGKSCRDLREVGSSAAEGGTLLSDAFANAERILALERKYPLVLEYQRIRTRLDSGYSLTGGEVDTIQRDTRDYLPYRTGRVLERVGGKESVTAFTTSDFAGDEFQRSHCFWYAGRDSVQGFSGYRIDFVPKPEITSPDWAGSMLVDSVTMSLLRTETHLVNLPRKGTNVLRASCTFFYQPIFPSLPQEFQTRCVTAPRGNPPIVRVERWSLINRRFLGKAPVEPEPRN